MARGTSIGHHWPQPQGGQVLAGPPRLAFFVPQPAVVGGPSIKYPPASLLGAPQEVRDCIWGYVMEEIRAEMKERWCTKPTTSYDGLYLVCRQIHHEIALLWGRCIVPKHRLYDFRSQIYSATKVRNFNALAIQIPFSMPSQFFSDLAWMLKCLSPMLQHLNLSFVGQDAYGTETSLHGCGNVVAPITNTLPLDGQGFAERHPLINALTLLTKLRTLSIRNPNMPLLQSHILVHKRRLRKLHIECDPRSTLHVPWRVSGCGSGHLIPATGNFPPVRELFISSNAALFSVQVVNKLKETLEKLTWVAPNPTRYTGSLVIQTGADVNIILTGLSIHNRRLHTLRICIEDAITESSCDHGTLIGSFAFNLPGLTSLRNMELHFCSRSPFFQREIVEALPPGLERLYISSTLGDCEGLVSTIARCVFRKEQLGEEDLYAIVTQSETARKDGIPMRHSALTFVSYQYLGIDDKLMVIKECHGKEPGVDTPEHPLLAVKDSEPFKRYQQIASVLTMNGCLLDRARNKHLAAYEPGAFIPPKQKNEAVPDNDHPEIETALKSLYKPTEGQVRTNATMLQFSGFTEDPAYFGQEKAAEEVFLREQEMTAEMLEQLEPRMYPKQQLLGPNEHWICP